MLPEESRYPDDWLRLAEQDWRRATWLLDEDDPGLAGFCLQQAVEKFFKAFLLSRGWQLRRTHDLEALLDSATAYDASLEKFRLACEKITSFYVAERYPFVVGGGLTKEDIRAPLEQVQGLVERLRTQITGR